MGDFNNDVKNQTITHFFNQWEMREIMLEDRKADGMETPTTCNNGTLTINGISHHGI